MFGDFIEGITPGSVRVHIKRVLNTKAKLVK